MNTSPLLPYYRQGALRLTSRPESPAFETVLTFGDVPGEYAAARGGCALFDQGDRSRVTVRGEERGSFLHRILANDVRGLAPGAGNRNLLLSAKGKVLFEFELQVENDRIELSTGPGRAEALLQAIDLYLFSEDVRLENSTDGHAPLEICGPQAAECLATLFFGPLPAQPFESASTDELRVTQLPVAGLPGFRLETDPERVHTLWESLVVAGAVPTGIVVRDILRVENGLALFGVDIDDGVYPQEARLEDAYSLDKGCYIGQEVVAKIDTYGGLNKRLMALAVDHDDPIPARTRLIRQVDGERRDLGQITTWAYSFELDTGCVLAYVKRKHQEAGLEFELELETGERLGHARLVELPLRAGAVEA